MQMNIYFSSSEMFNTMKQGNTILGVQAVNLANILNRPKQGETLSTWICISKSIKADQDNQLIVGEFQYKFWTPSDAFPSLDQISIFSCFSCSEEQERPCSCLQHWLPINYQSWWTEFSVSTKVFTWAAFTASIFFSMTIEGTLLTSSVNLMKLVCLLLAKIQ